MPEGFFSAAVLRDARLKGTPDCTRCGLYRTCKSPKMPPSGKGKQRILIVGEAPGATEDEIGRQFVGRTGTLLENTLESLRINMRQDCVSTNAIICRPPKNDIPSDKAVDWCRPNLLNTIKEVNPELILLMGSVPVKSLLGWLWKEDPGGVSRWAGYQIPSKKLNAWICPVWHPSFVARNSDEGRDGGVSELVWRRHLKMALSKPGRPWTGKEPDINSLVDVEFDTEKAAAKILTYLDSGKPLSFDLETNGIKPDAGCMRIYSCAISDGETAIAYPWHGKAITATRELLRSGTPKIGYNAKFDLRWIKVKLGVWAKNVVWDGMLAAHVLDNRSGTKSLKFQAFALLGEDSYDNEVKSLFKSEGSNLPNRIAEVPLRKLLLYNGLDVLLTVRVARIQAKRLGIDL